MNALVDPLQDKNETKNKEGNKYLRMKKWCHTPRRHQRWCQENFLCKELTPVLMCCKPEHMISIAELILLQQLSPERSVQITVLWGCRESPASLLMCEGKPQRKSGASCADILQSSCLKMVLTEPPARALTAHDQSLQPGETCTPEAESRARSSKRVTHKSASSRCQAVFMCFGGVALTIVLMGWSGMYLLSKCSLLLQAFPALPTLALTFTFIQKQIRLYKMYAWHFWQSISTGYVQLFRYWG